MTIAPWMVWLIIAGFFFILEIFTEGFFVCWIGVGALVSLVMSLLFPANYAVQIAALVIISTILILSTRKLAKKISSKDTENTNVYTILGKKATVTQAIDNVKGLGQIKIDGDVWSAKNESEDLIAEGESVEVIRIDGVKAIVKKI